MTPTPDGLREDAESTDESLPRAPWRSAHALFEAEAQRVPEAPALVQGREVLSFAELDRRANRIANRLRALGVGRERRVGIHFMPSADALVAMLGVLKAGAAYVPLDPAH